MGLVTWLSSKPGSCFPKVELPEADKIVHIVLFAMGAFFASGAMLVSVSLPRKARFGFTVAVISVFGMLIFRGHGPPIMFQSLQILTVSLLEAR